MQPVRPSNIEAALLYQDFKPFAYAPFVERLRFVFGEHNSVHLGVHQDGAFGIITAGDIIIKLSQNNAPLGLAGFQGALSSAYMKIEHPDAEKIIQNHRKNIFVTVGSNSILMPDFEPGTFSPELEDIISEVNPPEATPSPAVFSSRVLVTRLIVSQLIHMNKPDLVHWCQSDQFFKPEQLVMAEDPRGMALQIHPNLFSSGATENGSQKIGFHAYGSEHVMGHHVFVEETPFALPRVIEEVNNFIYSISQTNELPMHGKVVRHKSGTAMRIHHASADSRFERNYIRVEMLELGTKDKPESKPAGPSKRKTHEPNFTPTNPMSGGGDKRAAATPVKAQKPPLHKFGAMAAAVVLYLVISNFLS